MASFNVGFAAQARRANASLGSLKPKSTADIAKSIMLSKPASPSLTKDVEYPENFTWRPPRLSIRESKGRGCGLFTFDFIPAYSRILEEHAMICVSSKQDQDADEIWSKYQLLSREARQDFDEVNASAYQIGKEKANIPYLVSRGYSKTTAVRLLESVVASRATLPGQCFPDAGRVEKWALCYRFTNQS